MKTIHPGHLEHRFCIFGCQILCITDLAIMPLGRPPPWINTISLYGCNENIFYYNGNDCETWLSTRMIKRNGKQLRIPWFPTRGLCWPPSERNAWRKRYLRLPWNVLKFRSYKSFYSLTPPIWLNIKCVRCKKLDTPIWITWIKKLFGRTRTISRNFKHHLFGHFPKLPKFKFGKRCILLKFLRFSLTHTHSP